MPSRFRTLTGWARVFELVAAQVNGAWWYVAAGYTIVFGGMAVFGASVAFRIRRARRRLQQML